MKIKTLRGSDGESIQVPILDMENVQLVAVNANSQAVISVDSGIYYVLCRDSDFEFTVGGADVSAHVRVPWFQDVFLELAIDKDASLYINLPSDVTGQVYIIPTKEHPQRGQAAVNNGVF